MKTKRLAAFFLALVMLSGILPAAMAETVSFADVTEDKWYYNDVQKAVETGLINGYPDKTFKPEKNMTYAEAVKLAAVMHKLSMTGGKEFESSSPWYQTYVKYAKSVGIINKDYEWNEAATRAGYIEIFANAIPESPALDGVKGLDAVNSVPDGLIPDVPMSHPQAASIYKLYRAGILQGNDSKHSCKPDSNIRRSEVAAVLNRMMNADARISFSIEPEPLVISLPESLSGKADKQISIPATATGGTGPYSYEWFFAKTPGSTWLPSAEESSTYTSKFVYVDKLYCKCKVTDSAGNTAESNICEITLTK